MNNKDKIFLNDYVQFQYLNHFVVADSLYKTLINPENVALDSHQKLEFMNSKDSYNKLKSLNTNVRVGNVAISRLYAEYVSTIEDFGALMFAISDRNNSSVFENYFKSSKEVTTFFDNILKNKEFNLVEILNLPKLEQIKFKLDQTEFLDMQNCYEDFSILIKDVAEQYRQEYDYNFHLDYNNNKNDICLVLDLCSKEKKHKNEFKLMTKAFNKIKHRFIIIEDFNNFAKAEPLDKKLIYTYHTNTKEWADKIFNNISAIIINEVNIVSLLIYLEQNGIQI